MPASLAAEFTLGEDAALCIIATNAGCAVEFISTQPSEVCAFHR
jgi:hypothetical protein